MSADASHFVSFAARLNGARTLVVGGGRLATRRAKTLARGGAKIDIVTLDADDAMRELAAQQNDLNIQYRAFVDDDILEKRLVVAATADATLNARIAALCDAAGVWVNDVSSSDNSSFIFPSVIERDPIQVSVLTGGASPTLARMLKAHLANCIPAGYRELAQLAERYRERVKRRFASEADRRQYWRLVIHGRAGEMVLAGRLAEAEREMRNMLNAGEAWREQNGEVSLVGAGPGDPDLLTFKALRLMQKADVVLYDRLVSQAIMDLLPDTAQKIYAGKERSHHAIAQKDINDLLINFALEGKNVLRLKGGDPFVFGRGGEEIERLMEKRITFQVVPGITAASGCAAYAGIPLTHRDYAQACIFSAGYLKDGTVSLDWDMLARADQTLVFYMGLQGLNQICSQLVQHGLSATTPAALITCGTLSKQDVLVGDLGTMVNLVKKHSVSPPTLIIVGEVVRLRDKLQWFNL